MGGFTVSGDTHKAYLIVAHAKVCLGSCQVASTQLGVGVMTLKRVCRANNIHRWPFHKRKSLGNLIEHTKRALADGTGRDNMQNLAVLQVLEKQRQVM